MWRNFLHVGNCFSLTSCTCCAKTPASSSEIFIRADSCRNKLNRTTSNFTTEMKTACGVIKNQASNRQKKCGYCLPRARKPFWNCSFFSRHFTFHISKWFPIPKLILIVHIVSKRHLVMVTGNPGFRPTTAWPAVSSALCGLQSFFDAAISFVRAHCADGQLAPTALTRKPKLSTETVKVGCEVAGQVLKSALCNLKCCRPQCLMEA